MLERKDTAMRDSPLEIDWRKEVNDIWHDYLADTRQEWEKRRWQESERFYAWMKETRERMRNENAEDWSSGTEGEKAE